MSVLAAPGDTWGIPGPTFLAAYLAAAVLVIVVSVIHRAVVVGGRRDPGYDRLGPQQAAYLNGGDQLAVYTALGGLRASGVIGVGPDSRLAATGPMPAGITPLDQAVHNAAGRRAPARELRRDQWVVVALTQLREGLEQRGLAISPARRASARRGAWLLLALLGLGSLRVVTGVANDRPVGLLILFMVLLIAPTLLLARVPYRTRAARTALTNLRRQHTYLAPTAMPAYNMYGATGAAMGVALFGTASLWALDPTFAQEAEIQRQAAGGSGGYTSSSDGGSSGDSGGSSGDSGGGSSCGGGGGCGG